ncbi:MAG: helix-turn-helix domain-containing protein [Desulfatiglans sp.]|jgi:DNA-binding XRE family transcriptional regulator/KaiC/GvpD/RAD55 family RecA-like ATPase|nr:helix-turn-helix domain-containing protein [Thermodesulfobacteriota bacterium]MEE4354089.1 helix-turn-helix domain-containing protein [Desulfatiglans sp.]
MTSDKKKISSGIGQLDQLLGGGIYIGDNVVWYDEVGSLAPVFYLNLMKVSKEQKKHIIYINFDRSIKNLLSLLGPLAENRLLTILDCFTYGKGEGAEVFLKSYDEEDPRLECQILRVDEPHNPDYVTGTFYALHKTMNKDVRFIFDSLTGMQELWGREDHIIKFYSHSCPRLYELNTVAYWIVEKEAHSQRLKAHINKVTQVAIDLTLKRGKTSLSVIKADNRDLEILNRSWNYWSKDLNVTFDSEKSAKNRIDLGSHLRELRARRGISQTELARLIGVTPSTISQVENSQIYPSLPALIKMAETLSISVSSFFKELEHGSSLPVFHAAEAVDVPFPSTLKGTVRGKLMIPVDFDAKAEPYLIEIPPKKNLSSHFFIHKGEEVGYLLSGKLQLKVENETYSIQKGDIVYLTSEMPSQWKNIGANTAKLLWFKIK